MSIKHMSIQVLLHTSQCMFSTLEHKMFFCPFLFVLVNAFFVFFFFFELTSKSILWVIFVLNIVVFFYLLQEQIMVDHQAFHIQDQCWPLDFDTKSLKSNIILCSLVILLLLFVLQGSSERFTRSGLDLF